MIKKLMALILVGTFLLAGCSGKPKAVEEFYSQLYLNVDSQLDDGYTDAQLSAIDTSEERNAFFSISYQKVDVLMKNLSVKANAALDQASEDEKKILIGLIEMYDNYSKDSQNAIRLLSNYDKECPAAADRPAGTLPSHACGEIYFNATDLKETSLACVYYVSAKFMQDFPGFDKNKVEFLNSGMSEDVISEGCDAFRGSASLLGYPYRVSRWVVPEKMQREIDSEVVIAVADSLYTNAVSGVPVLEQAVSGSWFGNCSAFESMQERLPNRVKSGNCW